MNETITTIVGNVVDQPSRRVLDSGVSVTSFRVASTARRFDRVTNRWVDGDSLYLKVTCWRSLAENTQACVVKGDPVVVTGKLYTRLYEVAESRRAAYELEATAIGFDLNRGRASFRRISSSRAATVDEAGPDGLPTGGAVDAHLDSGVTPEGGVPVESEPLDEPPMEDLDGPAPAFSDAAENGRTPDRTYPGSPVDATSQDAGAAGDPVTGDPATGDGATRDAATRDAATGDDTSGEHSADEHTAGDGTAAVGRVTPRPPGRRRGASPVPA